jgi:Uma2 family endonuclease
MFAALLLCPSLVYLRFMNVPLTTVPITRAAEGLERRAFTVRDVIRMVETGVLGRDERFELIGGEIVPMSPKGIRHERLKLWLNENLVRGLSDAYQTIPETTFYLSDDTFIEPDFVFHPRDSGLENLSPETCLLAIEIADSSLTYDLGRKAKLYAEFGIKELWVVDVNMMTITVHIVPGQSGYGTISANVAADVLKPICVKDFSIRFSEYRA